MVNAEERTNSGEIPKTTGKDVYEKFGTGANKSGNNGTTDAESKYKDGLQNLEEQPVNIVLTAGLPFSVAQSDIVCPLRNDRKP